MASAARATDYRPFATAFADGTEIVTESGCVHTGVPLVKSKRFIVIFGLS